MLPMHRLRVRFPADAFFGKFWVFSNVGKRKVFFHRRVFFDIIDSSNVGKRKVLERRGSGEGGKRGGGGEGRRGRGCILGDPIGGGA